MKHFILIFITSILTTFSFAQNTIEGFVMGCSKNDVMNIMQTRWQGAYKFGSEGYNSDSTEYLHYDCVWCVNMRGYYSFKFKNDKLIYFHNDSGTVWSDTAIEDKYIDLVTLYGNPDIVGNSTIVWRKPKINIKFSYNAYDVNSIFTQKPPLYEYYYRITYEYNDNDASLQKSPGEYTASGSGFVLTTNGIIATNYHVVEDVENVDVFVNRNEEVKKYNAKVLISDKTNDLSLLKIDDASFTPFPAIPYAIRTNIQDVGTSVFALGYPMSNILGEEIKATDGIISSKTGYQGDIVTYQISAPIQPGNSGGPLFDKQGNLIGITNAGVPDAQNVGYAIKASYLRNLTDAAPVSITLPSNNTVSGLSFSEKIKRLTPYVVLIKVN